MLAKGLNRIFKFWSGTFFLLAFIFINTKIHIYGRGVENENELTFGLFELIGIRRAMFYEISTFFFCVLIAAIIFLISTIRIRENLGFDFFYFLSSCSFLIMIYIFFSNYTESKDFVENVDYQERYFAELDDLISEKRMVWIRFNEINYRVIFYSLITFVISNIILVIYSLFPNL